MHKAAVYQQTRFERITRWIGLFVLAPALLILTLPVAIQLSHYPDYGFSVHNLTVVAVAPDGPAAAAGIQPGDRVVRMGNRPIDRMSEFYGAMSGLLEQAPDSLTVRRGERTLPLAVSPVPMPPARLIRGYSQWVTGLFFLGIAWWVLFRRADLIARNFFALCMIFAFFMLDVPDRDHTRYMEIKQAVRLLLQFLLPAYFLRFFWQFPVPLHRKPGSRQRLRLLLVPGYALFAISWFFRDAPPESTGEFVLEGLSLVYTLGFFLTGLVLFARKAFVRDRPIMRTKMLFILIGLLGGLVPFLAALLISNLSPGAAIPQWQYLTFSVTLVPVSFGLAILRYGALDRAFVVRVGLIYGSLTLLLLVGYVVLVVGLGHFLTAYFDLSKQPLTLLLVALVGLAVVPLRRLIQSWIDRAFYPARRANRKTMRELADRLTGLIDSEQVIETFTRRLSGLYRPQSFALYLAAPDDDDEYLLWRPAGQDAADDVTALPASSTLAMLLDRLRRPIFVEEMNDLLFAGRTDRKSTELLARLRAALLVPLVTGNRLLGFTAFGPKASGELYSQEDLTLLHSLMIQVAPLIESRQLYKESLQRRDLEKELEVARGIQSSLLPDRPLVTDSFSIAGLNESCRLVGGDYFDYFLRPDGSLGFAIADVAGKGVPAALQMTSLRAAFRNLADTFDSPSQVLGRLSQSLEDRVSAGQFVCFFYGIWQPETRLLTYCNAGMDPPILFRSDTRFQQFLKKGGPVLGVNPEYPYREGNLVLQPGDQVFLYTDGLTEEINEAGDFFDSARLIRLVAENLQFSPLDLLRNIFSRVNEFGGPEKSDDKTAILLEVNT